MKEYVAELDRAIGAYLDSPCQELLLEVLCCVFEGIEKNHPVSCPVELFQDGVTCEPLFFREKDGSEHLVILTQPDGTGHPTIAELKLQGLLVALIRNDHCEGFVFNPYGSHKLFLPKMLFLKAFQAALQMEEDWKPPDGTAEE